MAHDWSMTTIPYSLRVLVLALLAVGLILYDRMRHPGRRDRIWEYGLLFAAGLVGAAFGAVNDSITVGISPEYFILGKGLAPGEGLKCRAVLLGAQAGFSGGIVACAVWLFALGRVPAKERCHLICRFCWLPVATAAVAGCLTPFIAHDHIPAHLSELFSPLLFRHRLLCLARVWWIHTGLYAGLFLGAVGGICLCVRRNARTR